MPFVFLSIAWQITSFCLCMGTFSTIKCEKVLRMWLAKSCRSIFHSFPVVVNDVPPHLWIEGHNVIRWPTEEQNVHDRLVLWAVPVTGILFDEVLAASRRLVFRDDWYPISLDDFFRLWSLPRLCTFKTPGTTPDFSFCCMGRTVVWNSISTGWLFLTLSVIRWKLLWRVSHNSLLPWARRIRMLHSWLREWYLVFVEANAS